MMDDGSQYLGYDRCIMGSTQPTMVIVAGTWATMAGTWATMQYCAWYIGYDGGLLAVLFCMNGLCGWYKRPWRDTMTVHWL